MPELLVGIIMMMVVLSGHIGHVWHRLGERHTSGQHGCTQGAAQCSKDKSLSHAPQAMPVPSNSATRNQSLAFALTRMSPATVKLICPSKEIM
jgi:hypothetical protein